VCVCVRVCVCVCVCDRQTDKMDVRSRTRTDTLLYIHTHLNPTNTHTFLHSCEEGVLIKPSTGVDPRSPYSCPANQQGLGHQSGIATGTAVAPAATLPIAAPATPAQTNSGNSWRRRALDLQPLYDRCLPRSTCRLCKIIFPGKQDAMQMVLGMRHTFGVTQDIALRPLLDLKLRYNGVCSF
jgi:hypothetical protein